MIKLPKLHKDTAPITEFKEQNYLNWSCGTAALSLRTFVSGGLATDQQLKTKKKYGKEVVLTYVSSSWSPASAIIGRAIAFRNHYYKQILHLESLLRSGRMMRRPLILGNMFQKITVLYS